MTTVEVLYSSEELFINSRGFFTKCTLSSHFKVTLSKKCKLCIQFHWLPAITTLTVRVVKHQNRLPSKVAESPSFKIFKSQLDMVLCNLLQAAML